MVKGDEPITHLDIITEAVQPILVDHEIQVNNLLGQIKDTGEFEDRNCIKVVCDINSHVMFFTREPKSLGWAGDLNLRSVSENSNL